MVSEGGHSNYNGAMDRSKRCVTFPIIRMPFVLQKRVLVEVCSDNRDVLYLIQIYISVRQASIQDFSCYPEATRRHFPD